MHKQIEQSVVSADNRIHMFVHVCGNLLSMSSFHYVHKGLGHMQAGCCECDFFTGVRVLCHALLSYSLQVKEVSLK